MPSTADLAAALLRTPSKRRRQRLKTTRKSILIHPTIKGFLQHRIQARWTVPKAPPQPASSSPGTTATSTSGPFGGEGSPTRISDFPDGTTTAHHHSKNSRSNTGEEEEDDDDVEPLVSTILFSGEDPTSNSSSSSSSSDNESDDTSISEQEAKEEAAILLLQNAASSATVLQQSISRLAPPPLDHHHADGVVVVTLAAAVAAANGSTSDPDQPQPQPLPPPGGQLVCTPIAPHCRRPWRRPSRTSHLLYSLEEQQQLEEEEVQEVTDDDDEDNQGDEWIKMSDDLNNNNSNSASMNHQESSGSFSGNDDDDEEQNEPATAISSSSSSSSDMKTIDYELLSNHVVKMPPSSKKTMAVKPTRLERIQELVQEAHQHATIGNEDQSITLLCKAYKMAEAQMAKIKVSLYHHHDIIDTLHVKVQESASRRWQQDWHVLSDLTTSIQTKLAQYYEITSADYERAIAAAQTALSISKKQRKRTPSYTTTTALLQQQQQQQDTKSAASRSIDLEDTVTDSPKSSPSDNNSNYYYNSNKIIWYEECPGDIDATILSLQRLIRRLKHAEATFEQRKVSMETIIQRRNDGIDCLELAKAALSAEQDALGGRHSYIGDWYQLLAILDTNHAREHLLQAYDIHLQALGESHPRVGNDLILLAKHYDVAEHDIDTALYYYDMAVNIFCHIADGIQIVASILNDMGVLHVARGDVDIAKDLFHHALDLYQHDRGQADGGGDVDSDDQDNDDHNRRANMIRQLETVQVHRNIAECHFVTKTFEAAISSFQTALEIQKKAAAARANNPQYSSEDLSLDDSDKSSAAVSPNNAVKEFASDESIADTLRRLGKTHLAAQQYDKAYDALRESSQLFRNSLVNAETLTSAGLTGISISTKQDELAATLYFLAQCHEATASYDQAIRVYNESMQMRLASDSSQRPDEKRNMVHCAMCLTGLANVCYRQGNFMEAHKTYNKALFFCEAQNIPYENPLVRMIDQRRREAERRVEADAPDHLEKTAREEQSNGRYDQAIETLGTAISLRRAAMQKFDDQCSPMAEEQRIHIIRLLNTCREIFLLMGVEKKADRAKKEALALMALTDKHQQMMHKAARPQPESKVTATAAVTKV